MTDARGRGWRVIALGLGAGSAALMTLTSALFGLALALLSGPFAGDEASISGLVSLLIVFVDLGLIALLLAAAAYHGLRTAQGRPNPLRAWRSMGTAGALTLIAAWIAASILAALAVARPPWLWLVPFLHALAITVPVYLLSRVAIGGLPAESRLRAWGALATGLFLAPSIAVVAEVGMLLFAGASAIVYLFKHPEMARQVEALSAQLVQTPTIEEALPIVQPILMHPAVLLAVLAAVAVVIPVIEELAKSIAPWLVFSLPGKTSSGFWCGALSGAGFALFEGLLASADVSANWSAVLLIRGWSSLMHVLTTGIAGWGIVGFRCGRGVSRLVAGYGVAMALHAMWNASVVLMGFGGLGFDWATRRAGTGSIITLLLGGLVFMLLILGMPAVLALINRRLRAPGVGETGSSPRGDESEASTI